MIALLKGLLGGTLMRWLIPIAIAAGVTIFFGYGKVRYESGRKMGTIETYLEAETQVRSVRARQQRKNSLYEGNPVCASIAPDTVVCIGDRLQPQEPDRPVYSGSGDDGRNGDVRVLQTASDSSQ